MEYRLQYDCNTHAFPAFRALGMSPKNLMIKRFRTTKLAHHIIIVYNRASQTFLFYDPILNKILCDPYMCRLILC